VETTRGNVREFVDDLRQEWKLMWRSRLDDKVRAESIADKTYQRLFVDRGLILFATRSFKPPEFHEILKKHLTPAEAEMLNPNPVRGGIRRFIREYIQVRNKATSKRRQETRAALEDMKQHQQLKHGGRGWLHLLMSRQ